MADLSVQAAYVAAHEGVPARKGEYKISKKEKKNKRNSKLRDVSYLMAEFADMRDESNKQETIQVNKLSSYQ